jgi:ribosomal protein S18 acetylase RimI-like enzyme
MADEHDRLPGEATLVACWRRLARLSPSARVVPDPASVAAVFPAWTPLNNAILCDDPGAAAGTVARLASLYRAAAVGSWACWVPSPATDFTDADVAVIAGMTRDTTTLVMQSTLQAGARTHDAVVSTSIETVARFAADLPVAAAHVGRPDAVPGLFAWALVHHDEVVSAAWSCVHNGDCGIYAVGTLPSRRRRGFARMLVEHALADARRRGAHTASLQSTLMGQHLYEQLGFVPVGRYEEWVPAAP